jgi:hypothetical protein
MGQLGHNQHPVASIAQGCSSNHFIESTIHNLQKSTCFSMHKSTTKAAKEDSKERKLE